MDLQPINSGYNPQHKIKGNFLDYYAEFVKPNSRKGNRHLSQSLRSFKTFVGKDYLSPIDINETFCERFRSYLLSCLNGETPANYFSRLNLCWKQRDKMGILKLVLQMILHQKQNQIKGKEYIRSRGIHEFD